MVAKIFTGITRAGIDDRLPQNEHRFVLLINIIAVIMISFTWSYVPMVMMHIPDNTPLIWTLVLHGVFFLGIIFLNHQGHYLASRLYFGISSLVFMTVESLLTGPETRTHLFMMFAPTIPFFIYPQRERIYKFMMIGLILISFFGLNAWYISHEPIRRITDPVQLLVVQWMVLAGLASMMMAVTAYAHFIINRTEAQLQVEHEKAEALLRNILPDRIAERLKHDSRAIAEGFESASILFADIVGFTALADRTSPGELVEMLNGIFSRFDDIVESRGLEKIKTIGDAYMIAAGIPEPDPRHAEKLLLCACDMIEALEQFNRQTAAGLQIRIGINSGPVVAGVIGRKKFIYDLWGDSVNIASRMESHGVAGRIQVSHATYDLLKDRYLFEQRDGLSIKGKGVMTAWLFLGVR